MKRVLSELSLPELESLYRVLDEGLAAGEPSTARMSAEAGDGQNGREHWKRLHTERLQELDNIKVAIHNKVREINYK